MRVLKLLSLALILCAAPLPSSGGEGRVRNGLEIKQGKERKVEGEDLWIAFLSVAEDSRCPDGAKCIWEGNARIRLSVRNSKDECAEFELNTNVKPAEFEFGKYRIALANLWPYPSIKGELRPREYTATLAVTKAEK